MPPISAWVSRLTDFSFTFRWENTRSQVRNLRARRSHGLGLRRGAYCQRRDFGGQLDRNRSIGFLRYGGPLSSAMLGSSHPEWLYYGSALLRQHWLCGSSDFFYVWLRKSLGEVYPELSGTMATPKVDELIAPYRHDGSKVAAEQYFEEGFVDVSQVLVCAAK